MDKDLMRRLVLLLEAALPLLDREAAAEKRREDGKALRKTTAQSRARSARKTVEEALEALGVADG